MFSLICELVFFTSQAWLALSSPAKYDQRQEGDVNVQIDLKDVKIIALLKSDIFDDYTNYDYAYDYADFTIKPIVKPTKPSTTSNTPSTTTSSVPSITTSITASTTNSSRPSETSESVLSTSENKTTESASSSTSVTTLVTDNQMVETSTTSIGSNIDETSSTKLKVEDKPENLFGKIDATEEAPNATTEALQEKPVQVHKQTKRCRAGYDKSGRCHRRRISLLPLAMKVAPELVRSMRKRLIN